MEVLFISGTVESPLIPPLSIITSTKGHWFRRVHDTGTEALLRQHLHSWRIQINLRDVEHKPMTIVGCVAPTVELAQELAGRRGPICHGSCKGWIEF